MAIQQTFEFLTHDESTLPPGEGGQGNGRQRVAADSISATEKTSRRLSAGARPRAAKVAKEKRGDEGVSTTSALDQLRAQIGCINTADRSPGSAGSERELLLTGSTAMDGLLPGRGLRIDAITEWVAEADGCGAAALSMITAANRLRQIAGPFVVVCPPDQFYPPAAVALGIPANRIIWVRPTCHADSVWAIDQALRSKATAVLWAPIGARLDDRDARRFQLAAEIGSTPGLLLRPAAVRRRPTFADIRFHISNKVQNPSIESTAKESTRAMRVTLDRCRGGQLDRSVVVHITDTANIQEVVMTPFTRHQDESTPLHLASQLADPQRTKQTGRRRRA